MLIYLAGVVEEVLAFDPPRLRVRWEDGHTTVLVPTASDATVEPSDHQQAQQRQ